MDEAITSSFLNDKPHNPKIFLHASSATRLSTTPMSVLRGTPTHQLEVVIRVSRIKLQLITRGSVLPELTRSVLRLPLMVLTLLTFLINSIPACILFDPGASHSFISASYVNTHELSYIIMCKLMVVITSKGPIEANYTCCKNDITILGRNFWSTPVILEESEIDLILGVKWLKKCNAVIQCAKGTVELSSPDEDRFEVKITLSPSTKPVIYILDGKFVGDHIERELGLHLVPK
jgi:hypothetical protein